jgi:hypothetical protein
LKCVVLLTGIDEVAQILAIVCVGKKFDHASNIPKNQEKFHNYWLF